MVTAAEVRQRIDANLHIVRLKIDDLSELAQTWPEETRENQLMELHEWEDTLARLRSLREAQRRAHMTESQGQQYEAVLAALRGARPTLLHLDLVTPTDLSDLVGVG